VEAHAERRVVVTGLGAVTPLGSDMETAWRRLVAGEGAGGPITAFDASHHSARIACEANDFEPARWLDRKTIRKIDRFAQFAVAAARMAESDAGLEIEREADRVGASIATAQGGVASLAACLDELHESQRIHPSLVTGFMPNMAAGWVSMELGTRGPLHRVCSIGDGGGRGLRRDSAGAGRGDALRGKRGRDHRVGCRRIRSDASALSPERRPVQRESAL
jgi:3-oxoacyl-(acyl-carrier-protein) synthase